MVTNEYLIILHLVFFPLSVSHHPSIVGSAAVVLQGERHPDAGDQDDQHGNNEAQDEEEYSVVQIVRALPVRSAAHPGGLWSELSPAWQQWSTVYSEVSSLPPYYSEGGGGFLGNFWRTLGSYGAFKLSETDVICGKNIEACLGGEAGTLPV